MGPVNQCGIKVVARVSRRVERIVIVDPPIEYSAILPEGVEIQVAKVISTEFSFAGVRVARLCLFEAEGKYHAGCSSFIRREGPM
ncbi:MAG TPA: hypothetical protein VF821_04640, partial [Lentzea sp.]